MPDRRKKQRHQVRIESAEPAALAPGEGDPPADGEEALEASEATAAAQPESGAETATAADELEAEAEPDEPDWQRLYEEEHDRHLRAVAELRNYQRRVTRERAETMQYANCRAWEAILPIADDLERALEAARSTADIAALGQGVQLILERLRHTMADFGVARIPTEGEMFDPTVHEAVERVETTEREEGAIVGEMLPGYKLHDRVLRPARVQVAAAPKGEDSAER
jgi:molecular chaperone GrpE